MPQNYLQRQSLYDFILSAKLKGWENKRDVLLELSFQDNIIFIETDNGNIAGCLLVREEENNKFYCSLLIANSKQIMVKLAKAFRKKYPQAEVTSSERRGKPKKYFKSIIDKVSNL